MLKEREYCTGCAACVAVCPVDAIQMQPDDEGFFQPVVNVEKCIQCNQCEKICREQSKLNTVIDMYAAQNTDKAILEVSTSGGAIPAICSAIFALKGTVFAASYEVERGGYWVHMDSDERIKTIQGSKYLQIALTKDVYQAILDDLKIGVMVAAIGTPCQIDGIKKAIPARLQGNLILIDIICGGVISPKIEKLYEHHIESKSGKRVAKRTFRCKQNGVWESVYCSRNSYIDGSTETYIGSEDLYTRAYTSARLLRESCYRCPYAKLERAGDLTVGDCWGIEKEAFSFPNAERGVSLLLVNTEKGKKLIKNNNRIIQVPLVNKYPIERNRPLHECSKRYKMRDFSYKLYSILPFNLATGFISYRYMIKRVIKGRNTQ